MQKAPSQYFRQLVSIYSYFSACAKQKQADLPQSIKLMQYHQLFENIGHQKFETQLMKDILIYLINHYIKCFKFKSQINCLSVLRYELFKSSQENIINRHFSALAISQFLYFDQDKNKDHRKYVNKNFYELDFSEKIKILCFFIEKINQDERGNLSKIQNSSDNQILCLGNDDKNVYFFIKCLPWNVYKLGSSKKWEELGMEKIQKKVAKLLQEKKSFSNLFLIKNFVFVLQNYMLPKKPQQKKLPIHHAKNQLSDSQLLEELRKQMRQILHRYCTYIKKIDTNYEHAPPHDAKQLDQMLNHSSDYPSFVKYFQKMFHTLKQGVFIQKDNQNEYTRKFIIWANLFYRHIIIDDKAKKGINISHWVKYFIQNQEFLIQHKTMLDIITIMLKKGVSVLQFKQQRYYRNMEKKLSKSKLSSLSFSDKSQSSAVDSEEKQQREQNIRVSDTKMRLRNRKKNFGITLIDSDEDYSSIKKNLRSYEYKC